MNIFSDFHHAGLYYSLHLSLENRLGHRLYRPIGLDWFDKGFWDIAKPYDNNRGTIEQFLSLDNVPSDGTPPLNSQFFLGDKHFTIRETYHGYNHKAITFKQFLEMDIDIIIASIPDHWYTYTQLRNQYKPKAKVICQMGNMFNEVTHRLHDGTIKNLMASTIPFNISEKINTVFYYQEQPSTSFSSNNKAKKITSFVHLPNMNLIKKYQQALPDYEFKIYGAGSPDGFLPSLSRLYEEVESSSFVFQVKLGGDGYGWNWHTAYLMGRPVITNFSDYEDKLGGLMFEDGVTGIDLEAYTFDENVARIREFSTPSRLQKMQEACHSRFASLVDYEKEAGKVETFMQSLI